MRIEPSDSSALLTVTASSVVSKRPGAVQALVLHPGSAACSIVLYDPPAFAESGTPTTTGATEIVRINAAAGTTSVALPISSSGIRYNRGLIAVVTGTGATASVCYASF
jgi:hypothetical protein